MHGSIALRFAFARVTESHSGPCILTAGFIEVTKACPTDYITATNYQRPSLVALHGGSTGVRPSQVRSRGPEVASRARVRPVHSQVGSLHSCQCGGARSVKTPAVT